MARDYGQRFLVLYSGVLTVVFAATVLTGFSANGGGSGRFDTINVQRINIVEPDGKLRMVITNNRRIPGVIVRGREYADYGGRKATTAAGLLFFDAEGSESGGLTFGGRKAADGTITRWGHFSFDRYDQDQMFTISASDNGTNYGAAISMRDVPSWPIELYLQLRDRIKDLPPEEQAAAEAEFFQQYPATYGPRAMFAHENAVSAGVSTSGMRLFDSAFKERSRLMTDLTTGAGLLQFRDANGQVTHTYPPNP